MARCGMTLKSAVAITGVIAAYVLLEWSSSIHEYKGVPITPWNPGLGLIFGVMVLCGPRYAAVLFVGAVIAEIAVLRSNLWWPTIFGVAAIIAMATVSSPKCRAAISGSMLVSIGCVMLSRCWLAAPSALF